MKNIKAWILIGIFAGSLLPAAENTLDRFRADYVKSVLEGRPELSSPYYAERVRLMPEFQKTILGKANATAYDLAFAARFAVHEFRRDVVEIVELGSRLMESGTFHLKMSVKKSGEPRELTGKYLDIWEQTEGGTPLLVTSAWNHDRAIDFSDELRFSEVPSVQMALQARLPVHDRISFELAAFNRLLESAIIQHDGGLWSQFYADDVVMLANYSARHVGKKAVDAYIADHVKELPVFEKLDIRNDRIEQSGQYVIEYASHVANWRNGDSSGVSTGKNIRIWRREADGALRIIRQIGMYD
jgi:ketosteroid isomerase-like protein